MNISIKEVHFNRDATEYYVYVEFDKKSGKQSYEALAIRDYEGKITVKNDNISQFEKMAIREHIKDFIADLHRHSVW